MLFQYKQGELRCSWWGVAIITKRMQHKAVLRGSLLFGGWHISSSLPDNKERGVCWSWRQLGP
jgi:hypothetical protein